MLTGGGTAGQSAPRSLPLQTESLTAWHGPQATPTLAAYTHQPYTQWAMPGLQGEMHCIAQGRVRCSLQLTVLTTLEE